MGAGASWRIVLVLVAPGGLGKETTSTFRGRRNILGPLLIRLHYSFREGFKVFPTERFFPSHGTRAATIAAVATHSDTRLPASHDSALQPRYPCGRASSFSRDMASVRACLRRRPGTASATLFAAAALLWIAASTRKPAPALVPAEPPPASAFPARQADDQPAKDEGLYGVADGRAALALNISSPPPQPPIRTQPRVEVGQEECTERGSYVPLRFHSSSCDSNLGGLGPDFGRDPIIRCYGVGTASDGRPFDMILRNSSAYEPADSGMNAVRSGGDLGSVNLLAPPVGSVTGAVSVVQLHVEFVDSWLGTPTTLSRTYISFFALNGGACLGVKQGRVRSFVLSEASALGCAHPSRGWHAPSGGGPATLARAPPLRYGATPLVRGRPEQRVASAFTPCSLAQALHRRQLHERVRQRHGCPGGRTDWQQHADASAAASLDHGAPLALSGARVGC